MRFERPHVALAGSWRSMVSEFESGGEPLVPFPLSWENADFAALVARFDACSRGEGLPEGFVPHSTFWLVDDAGEVVAVSNLRHRLNAKLRREGGHIGYGVRPSARRRGHATALLRHTLREARAVGVTDALLTCAKGNAGSAGTILRCGGKYDSEEFVPERDEVVQRYWIAIAP